MRDGLANLLTHVEKEVLFSADYLAEAVTYCPVGGSPRSILAHLTTTWDELAEDSAIDEVQTLRVHCLRDPAAEPGGIASPRVGDTITRSDGSVFYYLRLAQEDASDRSWSLIFQSRKRIEQGAGK